MVLKLFTTFIVVAAILASPKRKVLPGVIVPVFIEFTDSVQQKAVSSLLWLVNCIKLAPSGEQAALLSGISGYLPF